MPSEITCCKSTKCANNAIQNGDYCWLCQERRDANRELAQVSAKARRLQRCTTIKFDQTHWGRRRTTKKELQESAAESARLSQVRKKRAHAENIATLDRKYDIHEFEYQRDYRKVVKGAGDRRRRYELQKLATPAWASYRKIENLYRERDRLNKRFGFICFHVDHVIPLKGKRVCGLHVHDNLRVIRARANILKGNRYVVV